LSIGNLDQDDSNARDAMGTWLLGHRQRISFQAPYRRGRQVVVDAVIQVPCRYLEAAGEGERCRAHGFVGPVSNPRPATPPPLQHPDGTLTVVHQEQPRRMALATLPQPPRALPVLNPTNPCAGVPCRTADHTRGAACCRDLTLEIMARADDARSGHLEALLRARRSPYLCKTERVSEEIIECEVISACGYLEQDGISCALHHRIRPDGTPAKPDVCSAWPDLGPDDVGHPGCVLINGREGGRAGEREGGPAHLPVLPSSYRPAIPPSRPPL